MFITCLEQLLELAIHVSLHIASVRVIGAFVLHRAMDESTCALSDASDDSTSLDFTDEETAEGGVLDMSAVFSTVSLPISADPVLMSPALASTQSSLPVDQQDLTHASLLKVALDSLGLTNRPWKRRRVSGKQALDARVLELLVSNPAQVSLAHSCTEAQQTEAYNEFGYWYIRIKGMEWREGAKEVSARMRDLSNQQQYHWFLVREARMATCQAKDVTTNRSHRASRGSASSGDSLADTHNLAQESSDVLQAPGMLLT